MTKLKDITGKALSGEWGTDDETGVGIPVLRTTNFTNEGIVNYENVVTRIITKKDISEKYLQSGDIIIEKSGGSDKQPVGRVIYFDGPENTYLFNNFTGLLRVRDKNEWFPRYVFYSLFANYKKGGTRPFENKTTGLHNLKTDDYVSRYEITEIPLNKQVAICAQLDQILKVINLRRKEISNLDDLIKARFIELFGDPMTDVSKWSASTIGEQFNVSSGGTPATGEKAYWENGTIPWIGSNMCQDTMLSENDGKFITEEGYAHSSAKRFHKGTVLVALVGATIGKTALLRFDTTTNQNIAAIDVTQNAAFSSEFVFYHMQMLYSKFMEIGSGKFKMANQSFIRQLPLICPPIELQEQFAAFVEQTDKSKLLSGCRLFHSWAPENRDKPKHVGVPRRRTKDLQGGRRQQ